MLEKRYIHAVTRSATLTACLGITTLLIGSAIVALMCYTLAKGHYHPTAGIIAGVTLLGMRPAYTMLRHALETRRRMQCELAKHTAPAPRTHIPFTI